MGAFSSEVVSARNVEAGDSERPYAVRFSLEHEWARAEGGIPSGTRLTIAARATLPSSVAVQHLETRGGWLKVRPIADGVTRNWAVGWIPMKAIVSEDM